MLSLPDSKFTRLCDGISRRDWISLGGLGLLGMGFSPSSASTNLPIKSRKAKSCIFLYLTGGPPQHESWDPKPEAPEEIRGPFKPIQSATNGLQVCELMPQTAKHTKKICVLRSMMTNDNAHSSSGYSMLTGVPHVPINVENAKPGAPNDHPSISAIFQKVLGSQSNRPESVILPEHIWNDGGISWPGQDAGFLGRIHNPWLIPCHPENATFQIPGLSLPDGMNPNRLGERLRILDALNHQAEKQHAKTFKQFENQTKQALNLMGGESIRKAFNLDLEPDSVRERYGKNRWGQSVLLARRLVEARVPMIQVNWTRFTSEPAGSPSWDTHSKNAENVKNRLMPVLDQSYTALLEDLELRGLLDETLVIWAGEFGRTPKHNGNAGRDHWGHVFSAALAGGGIQGGQIIGSSDKNGAYVKDSPIRPQDLHATMYTLMGIPLDTEILDLQGRPMPICRGQAIKGAI
jgi:hypothetical protein